MAARPRRTVRGKALLLAYWNADRVWGRKFEMEHFLSQHDVDICLLSETFLNSGLTFRLANLFATAHTDQQPGVAQPFLSDVILLTLGTGAGPHPAGRNCHTNYAGRLTSESPCGIPFAFPPTDRSGPGRLLWWRVAGLHGRRSERQLC